MSALEKNKDLVRSSTEEFWNKRDLAAFGRFHAANFASHAADGEMSCEQYRALCQAFFTGFPDLQITIDDLVAEGDKVTKVWTARCTHKGNFMGIPATGKRVVVKGIYVYRVEGGKFAENWISMDNLGMMQQIGAIPMPAAASAAERNP